MRLERLKTALAGAGEARSAIDLEAIETVVGLVHQLDEARRVLSEVGVLVVAEDGTVRENPAARVERAASAELRGWVKDRPDLFGEQRAERPKREKFTGFKAV